MNSREYLIRRSKRVLLEHNERQAELDLQRAQWLQEDLRLREQARRSTDRAAIVIMGLLCFLIGGLMAVGEWSGVLAGALALGLGRSIWREARGDED